MIKCPACGEIESKVIDSRGMDDGIRRRRQCLACGGRYTSYERIQSKSIFIIKKDGRREEYNRDKLMGGIRKACEKRPLPIGTIDKIVDSIEAELYQMGKSEIASTVIGDRVMRRLEELDHIAYIRFASVYRDFTDISALKQEVDKLINGKNDEPPSAQLFLLSPEELVNYKKSNRRRGK
jgi:transcriptional repressor NrdR